MDKGDSLQSLAEGYRLPYDKLLAANHGAHPACARLCRTSLLSFVSVRQSGTIATSRSLHAVFLHQLFAAA